MKQFNVFVADASRFWIARAQRRHYGVHEEKARKQEYVRWFREELNKVFGLNDPVE